jgi:hypothetical protein
LDFWTGGGGEVDIPGQMNGSEPMVGKIDEMTWDEMGRCVMIVRIACAIFPFFRTVGIGISGGRIAFYLHF